MRNIILICLIILSSKNLIGQTIYTSLSCQYASEGNYEKAIELEREGLDLWERIHGMENAEYCNSSEIIGYYYSCLGNYQEAIKWLKPVLGIRKKILGEEHPDFVRSLENLAVYNSYLGNYTDAVRLGTEALEIGKKALGEEHPDYARSLGNLASYNSYLENYKEAARLGTEALEIGKKTLGEEHPDYATYLGNLASYNSSLGNYKEAVRLETKALEIRKKTLGEGHPDYARSLGNLASYNSYLGNYKEAVRLGTEALEIGKKTFGEEHPDYTTYLGNLASYNSSLGNYKEAIKLETEALEIRKKTMGEEHPDFAMSIGNLASYNSSLGNYKEAVRLETKALEIRKKTMGEEHQDYAMSIGNLALYNLYLGNYTEAIRLGTEAHKIRKKILGEEHPDFARSLGNLASYNSSLGNYKEAIKLETEALEIWKKTLGEEHTYYANSLGSLAIYNSVLGNYREAIRLGTEALEIFKNTLGGNHPKYAMSLGYLAEYNSELGNYREAIRLGIEALEILKKTLGENHPDYARTLGYLAWYYYMFDDKNKLNEVMCEYIPKVLNMIRSNFSFLTKRDRSLYWEKYKNEITCNLSKFIWKFPDIISVELLDALLFSKGLLLNSDIQFDQFIDESVSQELNKKFNEVKNIKLQLNRLYEKHIAERYLDTDSLERQANELERQLMQESAEYGDYTRSLSVNWQDIRDNLKNGDAAIEFVSFPLNNDSTMYMAYVLRNDTIAPALVKLFEEKEITKFVSDNPQQIYTNITASQLLWKKLEPYLKGINNVYFAPDGVLHQIAIEYLPDIDGNWKISDRYNLYRLSSTREIALKKRNSFTKSAMLYGGIKYNIDTQTMESESRKYEKNSFRGYSSYYNLADTLALRAGIGYLPFTLNETETVNNLMNLNGYASTFLYGNEATEESFKNLSGKHNTIIHISTHGFYWKEDEADIRAKSNDRLLFMSQFGENARRNIEDKALTRTGLFMAGANNALSGKELPEDVDDGILTAQEIANLDLRGLDLVVLSACQTGMGDISGDGVFGLQRGFKKAGANSILMSLWDVDDEATQILMTEFYKDYLGGMSKRDSLLAAQKVVRETPGFEDPEYWAAFILLDALN